MISTMSPPIATPEAAERGPRAWWLGLPPRKRVLLRRLLAAGVILVLIVSVLLARFLSVENAERSDEVALLQAEGLDSLPQYLADQIYNFAEAS